uniref:SAM-dependent MTase RsmB/NOP-type domain-containing protein n=1 Tax=Leptocylindrus danicus TaxID=163516 RepID=A0A7S2NS15_9STRA|mmetsp:Transcript_10911/g.16443  ORF Transcript_10911/g.16443 Transcript_10911/m.16443 type:complete len:829 (+) Transcript_10911:129-2615(+)
MGKNNDKRYKRKSQRGPREKKDRNGKGTWGKTITLENKKLETYYTAQNIFKDEEECKQFMDAMRKPLPASFRIGSDVPSAFRDSLMKELHDHTSDVTSANVDDKEIRVSLDPIKFVDDGFQFANLDRKTIRRAPRLAQFHDWLVVQTSNGFITRQETVSMLPPVAMDVQPHHKVLDMCAAPGSKTSQILETLATKTTNGEEPKGFIVANDSDSKRAYMLVHQLRRLNSPAIFVTSIDARFFPNIPSCDDKNGEGFFDRVLCDVPCSGDGTMRKNIQIWRGWGNKQSMGLHPLQRTIAERGLRLTKIGGLVCYSTCSVNPLENEAVVCELLREFHGKIKLIDVRSKFEAMGFKGRKGMTTWRVLNEKPTSKRRPKLSEETTINGENKRESEDKSSATTTTENAASTTKETEDDGGDLLTELFNEYKTYQEVPDNNNRITPSMFPPTEDEISKFHLDYCMRVHPHDNDTGGFFVAVFEKCANISSFVPRVTNHGENDAEPETKRTKVDNASNGRNDNKNDDDDDTNKTTDMDLDTDENKANLRGVEPPQIRVQTDLGNVPFIPIDDKTWDFIWPDMCEFYGLATNQEEVKKLQLKDDAQILPKEQIKARASGESKCFYFLTKSINDTLIDDDKSANFQSKVTVINTGLKIFNKNTKHCVARYRLNQEGVHFLLPYLHRRKITICLQDYILLVEKALFLLKRNKESSGHSHNLNIYLEHNAHIAEKTTTTDEVEKGENKEKEEQKNGEAVDDSGKKNEDLSVLEKPFTDAMIQECRGLDVGSFVFVLKGYEKDVMNSKMAMVAWKCRGEAINMLVGKEELEGAHSKIRAFQ